jgi:hypothetical protein
MIIQKPGNEMHSIVWLFLKWFIQIPFSPPLILRSPIKCNKIKHLKPSNGSKTHLHIPEGCTTNNRQKRTLRKESANSNKAALSETRTSIRQRRRVLPVHRTKSRTCISSHCWITNKSSIPKVSYLPG